ncbi:hypothetical protein QYE76_014679 [Lolium multiflorum]|uniref:UBC core domain-containing protein n=1 Tax=Lolium multiflorum TaxID=4521 RepID=A0AAD8X8E4_LOLMU|nr:hypothetical protein QYE76_014679 [Lolium multiflorum]
MVNVSWFKAASTCWEVECDDIVSAYDLRRDPDHSIFYGDVVVRLLSNVSESTPVVQQPQAKTASSSLSWVGRVVDLRGGHVQVEWGDKSTSTVLPHEISVVNKEHYTQLESADEDDVDAPQADNEQHDPEDATEVEGGSVGSADEVDVLTAAIQNVEVQEDLNGDDNSDEEYDQTVMIKCRGPHGPATSGDGWRKRDTIPQLPPSYPAVPPQVFYHSFGLRLNPNLYESGSVCLSLLNTFGGKGTEVWSLAISSILQVVVSLQALVLNDQPYYNEAGYEGLVDMPEGRRNALPYSGNAFLLTL